MYTYVVWSNFFPWVWRNEFLMRCEVIRLPLRNVRAAGFVANAALGLIRVSGIFVHAAKNVPSASNRWCFFAVWMSNTMGLCLLTAKTHSSGWEIPCWIFQLSWTKISLTSKFKPHVCLHVFFSFPCISFWLCFSWRFGLKPNDQILAEDKHKALWVETAH